VYLLDQLRDAPLLLLGTYRPQDATERLQTIAARWQREGRLRQLALGDLSQEEAADLLARLGPPSDPGLAAEWVRQSGGNPYFLTELHRAQTSSAPCDLAALVRARLQATVPTYAMHVLQAAAILGDLATFGTLQATSGRSEEETLDALDALVAAAVLGAEERGYRFVHPLVATVVREDLGPARRAFLHRRAGEALARAHASHVEQVAGALTEHFAAAGETGRAAHYADLAAAQALAVGAVVEAQGYAERALEWLPTPQRRLALGEALMFAGGRVEAQEQLEAARGGFERAGDAVGATRACVRLALMAIGSSQPDVARDWVGRWSVDVLEAAEAVLTSWV
jgi:predicted ATPase